jgi:hypothetical protein
MGSDLWGTDTPVSMPEPLPANTTIHVDMGGFGFTSGGIAHNFSEADLETLTSPTFLPAVSLEGNR